MADGPNFFLSPFLSPSLSSPLLFPPLPSPSPLLSPNSPHRQKGRTAGKTAWGGGSPPSLPPLQIWPEGVGGRPAAGGRARGGGSIH
uniref:Uncharacterized protein n=1 Tax=Oryza nivara TaxID=4536 RepID=A0A0E0GUQ8_ORYNI